MHKDIKIRHENNLFIIDFSSGTFFNKDFISQVKSLGGRWETWVRDGHRYPKCWLLEDNINNGKIVDELLNKYFPENPDALSVDNTEAIAATVVEVFSQTFREYAAPLKRDIDNKITYLLQDMQADRLQIEKDNKNTLQAAAVLIDKKAEEFKQIIKDAETRINNAKGITVHLHDKENNVKTIDVGVQHKQFRFLLKTIDCLEPNDRNIFISGPAGSGKTMAAEKVAESKSLDFEYVGAIDTEYKLSGFMDANGKYVETAFYRAWKHGKVMLIDEADASQAAPFLWLNGCISTGLASFPGEMLRRHPDFILLVAANTTGFGDTFGIYTGRSKLDGASLDRFVYIDWEYDESFESALADRGQNEWVECVKNTRRLAAENGANIIISPRASIKGAQLLSNGMTREETVSLIFGRFTKIAKWPSINRYVEIFLRNKDFPEKPENTNKPTTTVYIHSADNINWSKKLDGIKFIRENTDLGLSETKNLIEGILPAAIQLTTKFDSNFLMKASEVGLNIRATP